LIAVESTTGTAWRNRGYLPVIDRENLSQEPKSQNCEPNEFVLPTASMAVTKRVRIYTEEDVANHKSANSCWVTCRGKVYDVTAFMPDHPGGDDLIMDHAGTDVESIMKDGSSHDHSDSAYEMLEEYVIGRLGTETTVVREGAYSVFTWPEHTSMEVLFCRLGGSR
jgi:cytochrome b involved in lipid metabolism